MYRLFSVVKESLIKEMASIVENFGYSTLKAWRDETLNAFLAKVRPIAQKVLIDCLQREGRKIITTKFSVDGYLKELTISIATEPLDNESEFEKWSAEIKFAFTKDGKVKLTAKDEGYDFILVINTALIKTRRKDVTEFILTLQLGEIVYQQLVMTAS